MGGMVMLGLERLWGSGRHHLQKKYHVYIHFISVTTVSPRPLHLFPDEGHQEMPDHSSLKMIFPPKLFRGFLLCKESKFKLLIAYPIWPCLSLCDALFTITDPHVHGSANLILTSRALFLLFPSWVYTVASLVPYWGPNSACPWRGLPSPISIKQHQP